MDKLWRGVFANPIMKHRLHTGNIGNHIRFKEILPLMDDEVEEYSASLTVLGDGGRAWLVVFAFIPDMQEIAYSYVVWADAATPEQVTEMYEHGELDGTITHGSDVPYTPDIRDEIASDLNG